MGTLIVIIVAGTLVSVLAIPVMFYLNDPTGAVISSEISPNYKFGKWNRDKVFYKSAGLGSGNEIVNADLSSFQIIDFRFAKDKFNIYYEHTPIKVDHDTFYLADRIPKDKHNVYYLEEDDNYDSVATIIENADPETYEELEGNTYWGKDATHYYFKTQQINVDFNSFTFISYLWAKDKNYIYLLNGSGVEKTAINQKSFTLINENYIRDETHVAYAAWLESAPPPIYVTFPIALGDPIDVLSDIHLKHNNTIYLRGKPFDVDIESFHPFIHDVNTGSSDNGFSKDKNHVYVYDKILTEADTNSFTVSDNQYQDKDYVFYSDGSIKPQLK